MPEDSTQAFVGTYTAAEEDGIFGVRADRTGTLHRTSATSGGADPTFLALDPDDEHLYAVTRSEEGGAVVAYAAEGGTLSRLNTARTEGGPGPCYCSVDATDRCVLTAQYHGGTVSLLPLEDDGRVGDPTAVVEHEGSGPNDERQSEAHPHSIRPGPDNEYAYAPDLGADRVFVYELDPHAGTLVPAAGGHVDVRAGAGPRHLDFHPNGRYAYLINELDSTVTAFERDPATGALDAFATASTLPDEFEGENSTADIHVHPSGEYLYGSNRGHDSIAVYELHDGRPSLLEVESTRGRWPRNFALDPDGEYLFAENRHTHDIVTFDIEDDGTLTPTGDVLTVPSPVCMEFLGA